jgi:arylsulfatase A-like enzyme
VDGVSVHRVLTGEATASDHPPLYWEFHERGFEQAVRMGRWKAVRHGPGQPLELYDLETDLSEATDVAEDNPEVVAQIGDYLEGARTDSPLWPADEAVDRAEQ